MKGNRSIRIIILVLLVTFMIETISSAGFIDDWLTQKTESSPGYFEGQKRGYFTGGSFSARWPMKNDYLFSFEPPRLNFGCGGIDAFMGGFSFLNFEYLVQKLQRILQAAPAAAFDLALKNLCEPCSNVIKSMNAASDALNSLQLDDCKAAKVLAANIISPFTDNPKIKQEAEKRHDILGGIEDLPQKITEIWKSNDGKGQRTTNELLEGCPSDIKTIYNTPGASILEQMMGKRNFPVEYAPVMRALIGDIMISNLGDGQTGPNPTGPCSESKPTTTKGFSSGDIYEKTVSGNDWGTCTLSTDANRNLEKWTQDKLSSIYTKLSSRSGDLTAEEATFVNTLPLPVAGALKVAISTKQGSSILASLSVITAKAYALAMLQELYGEISVTVSMAESGMAKMQGAVKADCAIELITPLMPYLKEMRQQAFTQTKIAQADYANTLKENMAVLDVARRYQEFNKTVNSILSRSHSAGFAARAMGNGN